MVSYKEIQASNALINDATAPRVSIFVGGTSGVGKYTIRALASTGASVKIYLVGRKSSEEPTRAFIQELSAINPKADIIWTEAEISLLADVKRVCEVIKERESRVDLLFLSAGYAPFGTRKETSEGLELCQSLEYYSRMLFILHLLPLLRQSEAPRVISVLGGGMESARIQVDDPDLKQPGNFGAMKGQIQYIGMNTISLEKLASENHDVTFIHSWPGWVNTGNARRGWDEGSIVARVFAFVVETLIYFFGSSHEESGQRHLFESTSAAFGGRGIPWGGKPGINSLGKAENGLFLADYKCDCRLNAKALTQLREKDQGKIWEHTKKLLQPYL
ncbi:hypothetical protein V8C44DRAFT_317196 [Trichoderma aethiopicum]